MMQMLQLGKLFQIAIVLMVVVAIWQAFNGDPIAIAAKGMDIIQGGSEVVTTMWNKVNSR